MGRTACTERQCMYKGALQLFLPTVLYNTSPKKGEFREILLRYNHTVSFFFWGGGGK